MKSLNQLINNYDSHVHIIGIGQASVLQKSANV